MTTRRDLLAGAGAVVGSASLGGCSALPFGGDGGSGDDGNSDGDGDGNATDSGGGSGSDGTGADSTGGDGTGAESRAYHDWIHAVEDDFLRFSAVQGSELAAIENLPDGILTEGPYGVANEDVERQVSYGTNLVLEGSFDPATLRSGVEDERVVTLAEEGTYDGYERYAAEESSAVVGFREDTAILSDVANFESIVDAGRGEGERLTDANEDFQRLVTELGTGHVVTGSVNQATGDSSAAQSSQVAHGTLYSVGSDQSEQTSVAVYRTADVTDEEGLREQVEQAGVDASEIESTTDGRVVRITFTFPTEDLAA